MQSNTAEIALALLIFAIGLFVAAIILWVCLAPPKRSHKKIIHKKVVIAGEPGPPGERGTQGPQGPAAGGASPPLVSSFPVENTVFVDQRYGNDGTGQRENPSLPFQTLLQASNAALTGDTIWVRPDTYSLINQQIGLRNNVNWYFSEGVTLVTAPVGNIAGFMFSDNGASVNVEMTGYARVAVTAVGGFASGFLTLINPNSNVLLSLNSLSVTAAAPTLTYGILVAAGILRAQIRNITVTGPLTVGIQNQEGLVALETQTVTVSNGGTFSILLSSGHTLIRGEQLVANNDTTVFDVWRSALPNSPPLFAAEFEEVQLIGATGSFLVHIEDVGTGQSSPRVVLDIDHLSITSSPGSVIVDATLAADVLYHGNSIVISGAVVADRFIIVGLGSSLYVEAQSIRYDTGILLVQTNTNGLPSFAAFRVQRLEQTLPSATDVFQIVGGATQAITELNIDQFTSATNNVVMVFTDAVVSLAIQKLLATGTGAVIRTSTASSSTNVSGHIDSFVVGFAQAIDNTDSSQASTFNLQFLEFLLGSNILPISMTGQGTMTLNGNVFNIQSAQIGINVTAGNFELKTIELIGDEQKAPVTNSIIVANTTGRVTVDFDFCRCDITNTVGAFRLLNGRIDVRGNTLILNTSLAITRGIFVTGASTLVQVLVGKITVTGSSNGIEVVNGATVELQLGTLDVDGTGAALSILSGANTITGFIDVIHSVNGPAIVESATSASTTALRFDTIRSDQTPLGTAVIMKLGIGDMFLRGNLLDVALSNVGVISSGLNFAGGHTLDLDVAVIINDPSGITNNILVLNGGSTFGIEINLSFERCYVYINPAATASVFRITSAFTTLSLHGHDMQLLSGPGVPMIVTRDAANLLARFGSVRCPSQALLLTNDNNPAAPSRVDYFSQSTVTTSMAVGSPPAAGSPLFDIQPLGGISATPAIDLFVAGGYNNSGNAPVIQFTGLPAALPATRVYGAIMVGFPDVIAGPVGYTIVIAPLSANTLPAGVAVAPPAAYFMDPLVA